MVSPTEETTRGYLVVRRFDSGRVHVILVAYTAVKR
jgi:hypothetical protein